MRHAQLRIIRACASAWFSHAWGVSFARRCAYCARRGSGTLLAKPPLCLRLLDAWHIRLDAWTRGRLGAWKGASSSQAHTAAVVTEAAASAASAGARTAVAVRTAAGMAAVAATALLARRVERKDVVWCGRGRRQRREGRDDGDGVSAG